jgi:hypothetical protein
MRAWGIAFVVAMGLFAACGDDGGNTPIDAPTGDPIDAAVDAPNSDAYDGPTRTIFLNRAGGTYTVGANDSVANTQDFTTDPVTAPAYPYGDPEWNATRDCVAALFAPFNVNVVDVDPGAVDHVEILITTSPSVFGFQSGVSGVAPAVPDCHLLERGFSPVFATPFGASGTRAVCEIAASMAGILYGLDWAMHCPDVMTYMSGCGDKAFRDVTAMCGEFQARQCRCGGATQNSYRLLLGRLGLR